MRARRLAGIALLASAAGLAYSQGTTFTTVERGRYLVAAGDCAACHTADGGKPFAGGRAIPTPFGTIYSTNITPDEETGIGKWSERDFYTALHEGRGPGGKRYYPAFPYPWYTKITPDDARAIKAYLDVVPAVRQTNPAPDLPWPLSMREVMAGWNEMFFHEGTFAPNAGKSPEWNRGAYLVEGLGHCGACHSPKNALGGTKTKYRLQGGFGEHWYAMDLTGDVRDGLGAWSQQDIVEYLRTGSNAKAGAGGPMAEVVANSTQHLTDADLRAIATYLKDLAPTGGNAVHQASVDRASFDRGHALYFDNCIGCHMETGEGIPNVFPPVKGVPAVQADDPATVLQAILEGATVVATKAKPTALAMPAFGWKLSDSEVADLTTYIRNAWGNRASAVAASDVAKVRKQIRDADASVQAARQ
jgi:mono/diheme cytochrome c family protein